MTDGSNTRKPDDSDVVALKHQVPQVCIACHEERLGMTVTESDCLGFAACEMCTKILEDRDNLQDTKPN